MIEFINIGNGNLIVKSKIIDILSIEDLFTKRLIEHLKDKNKILDATYGRKTKTVVVMNNGFIILTALSIKKIRERSGI